MHAILAHTPCLHNVRGTFPERIPSFDAHDLCVAFLPQPPIQSGAQLGNHNLAYMKMHRCIDVDAQFGNHNLACMKMHRCIDVDA
jgi:hypothetical protein